MKFCQKCGSRLEDGVQFCTTCGTAQTAQQSMGGAPVNNGAPANGGNAFANITNTPDTTACYNPQDIAQNKVMAVLAYFGILWLIPFFAAKNSPYAKYHCNQGLNLIILEVAYSVISVILTSLIKVDEYVWGIYVGSYTPGWLTTILWLISIPLLILAILGIVNAATGKAKELPFIGKFKFIK